MTPTLTSVTAVVLVRNHPTTIADLNRLSEVLAASFTDVEIVLIVNGVSAESGIDFARIAEAVPDITIVFLNEAVHDDTARLLGIDHAISDFILFCTPLDFEIEALPKMIALAAQGRDLVIGHSDRGLSVERGLGGALAFWLFRKIYALVSGGAYEPQPPNLRLFGRVAALYVASRNDGEVLIRARSLGSGFSTATVEMPDAPRILRRGVDRKLGLSKAVRLILTGSAKPLRTASFLGFFGGLVSLFYAAYVVITYLVKSNVEPGWTTLSLQSAGMMFLMSTQFLFLSEYIVQIFSAAPAASRRHLVAREIHGAVSRRSGRLNVVDQDGRYQIGAPAALLAKKDVA
jgi:hypothetical protein